MYPRASSPKTQETTDAANARAHRWLERYSVLEKQIDIIDSIMASDDTPEEKLSRILGVRNNVH